MSRADWIAAEKEWSRARRARREVELLRFARQHFESLRPYRWRLERMLSATKPKFGADFKAIQAALQTLDRAAEMNLTPEEFADFREPWIPEDHA